MNRTLGNLLIMFSIGASSAIATAQNSEPQGDYVDSADEAYRGFIDHEELSWRPHLPDIDIPTPHLPSLGDIVNSIPGADRVVGAIVGNDLQCIAGVGGSVGGGMACGGCLAAAVGSAGAIAIACADVCGTTAAALTTTVLKCKQ